MPRNPSTLADSALAIHASGLTKQYGQLLAVDNLDLRIPAGSFFGLLGPNGSGKSSTVHMLCSLIRPSQGRVEVAGADVATQGASVRARIGVVFQDPALDRSLSVWENLQLAGRLQGMSDAAIARQADHLLALFNLADRRQQKTATLSGGLRRALDIARAVIHSPQVLFLDEPTIGLDLPARRTIWRFIDRLRGEGLTVFLTTHYLEEAAGCDEIAFIKAGRIIRTGTPQHLLGTLGAWVVEIETAETAALAALLHPVLGRALDDGETLSFCYREEDLTPVMALQQHHGAKIRALRWRRPNLNDVFLWVNTMEAA